MLLRPEELRDRLQVPLTATIPPRTPKAAELTEDNPETRVVTALTAPNVFAVTYQQAQDAQVVPRAPTARSALTAPPAGLCATCAHQKLVRTGRGSVFSMCLRARTTRATPSTRRSPSSPARATNRARHEPAQMRR